MSEYKNADTLAVIMEKYFRKNVFLARDKIINTIYLKPDFFILLFIYNLSLKHLALVLHSFG